MNDNKIVNDFLTIKFYGFWYPIVSIMYLQSPVAMGVGHLRFKGGVRYGKPRGSRIVLHR